MYPESAIDEPVIGEWAREYESLPFALKEHKERKPAPRDGSELLRARAGFYAQCTYIDHQIRLLIGTLREEGLLDNTIVAFVADHGDMLGNHGLWAKPPMLEPVVNVPFIIVPTANYKDFGHHLIDDRLVHLRDVMPTLLEMCGIATPDTVEGVALTTNSRRSHVYCEHYEDEFAMRMVRDERYKLIYYATGNRFQLFDLANDPFECHDLSENEEYQVTLTGLKEILRNELYGGDRAWLADRDFVGQPERSYTPQPNRGLTNQRGWRW
jgi:arylsulfatase A-like enzyme